MIMLNLDRCTGVQVSKMSKFIRCTFCHSQYYAKYKCFDFQFKFFFLCLQVQLLNTIYNVQYKCVHSHERRLFKIQNDENRTEKTNNRYGM